MESINQKSNDVMSIPERVERAIPYGNKSALVKYLTERSPFPSGECTEYETIKQAEASVRARYSSREKERARAVSYREAQQHEMLGVQTRLAVEYDPAIDGAQRGVWLASLA